MTHTVGIFVFDAVEVLDFAGPYEVFTTVSRMQARIDADVPPFFDVVTVGWTASPLRARAGLLDAKQATTHWEDIDDFTAMFPSVELQTNQRWVDQGSIVTSAGISAGIDMSLHLVERLAGRGLAERTARQMEWERTGNTLTGAG